MADIKRPQQSILENSDIEEFFDLMDVQFPTVTEDEDDLDYVELERDLANLRKKWELTKRKFMPWNC